MTDLFVPGSVVLCCAMIVGVGFVAWRDWLSLATPKNLKAELLEIFRTRQADKQAQADLEKRVGKLEEAMRIDGARIMAQAAKAKLPEFMR